MKNRIGRILLLLVLITAVLWIQPSARATAAETVQEMVSAGTENLRSRLNDAVTGRRSDWLIIALRSCGEDFFPGDLTADGNSLLTFKEAEITGQESKPDGMTSDCARSVLAILALGGDPRSIGGNDLIKLISSSQLSNGKFGDSLENGGEEMVNSHVWAMIALGSAGEDPQSLNAARTWLLDQQHADGGFHHVRGEQSSDVDTTAQAVVALILAGEPATSEAMQKALDYLHREQMITGGFGSWQTENLESTAAVLQALVAAGLDPQAGEWSKDGRTLIEVIESYSVGDGSFRHTLKGRSNQMATEQALIVLGDYLRGETVYQMMAKENCRGNREIILRIGSDRAMVNGRPRILKSPPIVVDGRSLVPVRFVAETMGIGVEYDPDSRNITCTGTDREIVLQIGSRSALVNGNQYKLDAPPVIRKGCTMVPLKFISEQMGFRVYWDDSTKQVKISSN